MARARTVLGPGGEATRTPGRGVLVVALAVAALAAACGSSSQSAGTVAGAKASTRAVQKAAATPDTMTVPSPQRPAKTVLVSSVTFEPITTSSGPSPAPVSGYLVVARDLAGHPGATLGYVRVPGGTSHNIAIPVGAVLTSGSYWVLLAEEGGPPGAVAPSHPDVAKQFTVS